LIDRIARIAVQNTRSLCWTGDTLVDWVAGGRILHPNGAVERAYVFYPFRFDSAIASPDGEFVVIYEKLGTKGLVLHRGQLVREINRSYYHAHVYEYPVAVFQLDSGRTILAHCPDEYCRLELEDIVTGERIGGQPKRKPADFFHSRLRVSSNGRWLLSAGWVWHPFSMVAVFDVEAALKTSDSLDQTVRLPEISAEVASAEFMANDQILIATSDESLDADAKDAIGSNTVAVIDLSTQQVVLRLPVTEPLGSLMPVDEDVAVSFYEHPKLFSLRTGTVLKRWETLKSGKQTSSIIWKEEGTPPPIAIDAQRRRFAVADDSGVAVVEIEESISSPPQYVTTILP
jgi:hypothetical protein